MIAHDVDPIELVVFLPVLYCKMEVLYYIIRRKTKLGHLVNRKAYTTLAFIQVYLEGKGAQAKLVKAVRTNYND